MTKRLLNFDAAIREKAGFSGRGAGVDEVGRGPLAGPVVAAAVIFFREFKIPGLNDSKQMSAAEREKVYWLIAKNALVGLGVATEEEIDTYNIYHASLLAMKRAVLSLPCTPDYLLVDGKARVGLPITQQTIIEGDAKSACIAAASVMAKVYRDAWMVHLDAQYPGYHFAQHKGYATETHLEMLKLKGPAPVHRRSFAPVRQAVEESLL